MDFIKTKKELYQKSEDCPDGSIEKQRPTAQSGWPRNECSALGQSIRPTEVSAKVPNHRPITHHDPGNIVPRSAKQHATPRTTKAREPGNKPRGRATRSAYHGRCIRPSRERTSHVRPRISSAKFIRSTTPADRESVRPRPFRLAHDPMSGRSSRTTVPTPRSTRSPF
ncbi:unnamed protein product [Microthlaspi erraticum]|uniref:Uncharacterized protein n=1 Tax=Microthlaspi erraticum TaxID=1685480 RepID=A0A6D2J373_9BRAS|nr:unnamed protein product [Microthlaspi erraticum]